LRQDDTRKKLRRRLLEEALEHRRRHPVPPMEEVLKRIRQRRLSIPRNPDAPDSTVLLREDRGGWPEAEPGQASGSRGIVPTRDIMLVKAKGDFSTLTPDGRAVVDTNRLIRSPEVKRTLAVLEGKIQASRSSQAENQAFQTKK
jgi:hypothetical protein